MWEPLPLILYGYAIHPLTPSRRDTRLSSRHRLSTVTEASGDDHSVLRDVVSLEVGDEVYAFEKYTPRGKEVDGVWYRGYVVCTSLRPPVSWPTDPSSSTSKAPVKTDETQQVYLGIFPASHIYVRDELADAEGRLPDLVNQVTQNTTHPNGHVGSYSSGGSGEGSLQWGRQGGMGMDTLREEDEEPENAVSRPPFRLGPPPDQFNSRGGLPVYQTSLRSLSPAGSSLMKLMPPRPSLKSGDDTAAGSEQPIIDEIASAMREWHMLMFQYLARRDYKLFQIVKDHIEALHLGRRQLLAQTLSAEETVNMRSDCVERLVSGNLVQGLDVIVRHPKWGGLVKVDVEGEADPRFWTSAICMYTMQVASAYMDVAFEETKSLHLVQGSEYGSEPLPTPANSAFSEATRPTRSRIFPSPRPSKPPTAKFYHIYLDLRAFVASPCAPGETAELYFSLYRKHGGQFVTEDFCAILNHNGVLARDPSGRIRTLFLDLAPSDVQDPIFLVCRIIRNGALKIGNHLGSGALPVHEGRKSDLTTREGSSTVTSTVGSSTLVDASSISGGKSLVPQDSGSQFRRPFGCAVLELTQLSRMVEEQADVSSMKEHTMPIFIPTNEISFSMIHQNIINNNTREFEKSPRAEMLAVSIKAFRGDAQTVIRENTSLLQEIPHTLRLGFPDVVFPGDSRNELYIKLWSGDFNTLHGGSRLSVANFARGQVGTPANNIEVTIEVKDRDGRNVESVISQGSGEPMVTRFNSMIFQRCNEPTFGELIKIQLPSEGIPDWHLFITFRNRTGRERPNGRGSDNSERPFAFAFQPLLPDQSAFLEDGSHTLIMYRADKMNQLTPSQYLSACPSLVNSHRPERQEHHTVDADMQRLAPPLRDSLTIRTSLCSTRFTHNSVLLDLLNWEKISDREVLISTLTKFTFVGEGEIVKFLRNIFDALFGMLVSNVNQSGDLDTHVFNAIVWVLGIVQDRRFSNFQPVLDVYIEKHFNCSSASSHMINSMNRFLTSPATGETGSSLRAAFKVWHYVFKFIARSRELKKAKELGVGAGATADHLENSFKRDLRAHLNEINRMMSATTPPAIIGTQTIALQHFTSILPELAKIFSPVELVSIATGFANAITATKGKIVIWKLIMYLQIVKGFLFDNNLARPLLVEAVVIWIKSYFGRYDEYAHTHSNDSESVRDVARISWLESTRLCVTIVAVMLDKLQTLLTSPFIISDRLAFRQEQDNVEYLLSLIPRLLESYIEFLNPATMEAIDRAKSPATTKAPVPVTFPESYPFSLIAYFPDAPRNSAHSAASSRESKHVYNAGLAETAVVFLALVLTSPAKHVLNFLESDLDIEGKDRFVSLLIQFFKVANSILDNDAFPKTWLNVNVLAHKVLVRMMNPIATILEKEFIPPQESESEFNVNLWKDCLAMLLKLLSSDQLVIEDFSSQKRRALWRLGGDIRGEGANILLTLWQALGWPERASGELTTRHGGYQIYLHPLVGHVVNLCLSHHEQLRSNAVQILYSMIVAEYHQYGHFNAIETELVTRLDYLFMSDSKGDDITRAFFITYLRQLFDSSPDIDEQLRERVATFLDSVDLFLELLLSVRALPDGEEFQDDRVIATLRLMNFIRRIGRDEIYIKYVHQLVNMHLQSQNYVEAALTLKLHSDLHEWDLGSFVGPMEDLGLPQQSQFHRKETLCLLILDYLGKGKAWESAIQICKELAFQHAEVTFNYARLAEILRHQATLSEHIITEQRYYPDYYRVTFYGNFPVAIRDKRFIYRGFEWEKFGAFCERMTNKHPGAQLLKGSGEPPPDIRYGNEQYIQCSAVTPEPNKQLAIFTNPDVPLPVKAYYEHSDINLFSSSREVKKVARDGSEEMWIEKIYFTTEEAFPTVLRRSEVIDQQVVEISPIENALIEVETKTKELESLRLKYTSLAKTTQRVTTNALAMALNGVVDTPPDVGITSYRQTFFAPDYVVRFPERAEFVEKLRTAIDEQVHVIDECLKLHGLLCPPEFAPFHETLKTFFKKNFREEIRRLAMDADTHPQAPSLKPKASNISSAHYQPSIPDEYSLKRSISSSSTTRPAPSLIIPPLNLGHNVMTPSLFSANPMSPTSAVSPTKQTPLQRHLAHLTRHGFSGVASAPGDMGSDNVSVESPHNSFVNVGNHGVHTSAAAQMSGASINATSTMGSMGSMGSVKGRFSRFGSLNFGRSRGGSTPN